MYLVFINIFPSYGPLSLCIDTMELIRVGCLHEDSLTHNIQYLDHKTPILIIFYTKNNLVDYKTFFMDLLVLDILPS